MLCYVTYTCNIPDIIKKVNTSSTNGDTMNINKQLVNLRSSKQFHFNCSVHLRKSRIVYILNLNIEITLHGTSSILHKYR